MPSTTHWADDEILFTTNYNGQLDDVKLDFDVDYTPLDSGYKGIYVLISPSDIWKWHLLV